MLAAYDVAAGAPGAGVHAPGAEPGTGEHDDARAQLEALVGEVGQATTDTDTFVLSTDDDGFDFEYDV